MWDMLWMGIPTLSEVPVKEKEYDTTIDSRKRITLREAQHTHYHVVARDDGVFELHPRVLVDPRLSRRTLAMMDEAMAELSTGSVSEPVDPGALRRGPTTRRNH
jgi:hypothetical protein